MSEIKISEMEILECILNFHSQADVKNTAWET
jgi:hypothetical protein